MESLRKEISSARSKMDASSLGFKSSVSLRARSVTIQPQI
jgi:hypothetical protein